MILHIDWESVLEEDIKTAPKILLSLSNICEGSRYPNSFMETLDNSCSDYPVKNIHEMYQYLSLWMENQDTYTKDDKVRVCRDLIEAAASQHGLSFGPDELSQITAPGLK